MAFHILARPLAVSRQTFFSADPRGATTHVALIVPNKTRTICPLALPQITRLTVRGKKLHQVIGKSRPSPPN